MLPPFCKSTDPSQRGSLAEALSIVSVLKLIDTNRNRLYKHFEAQLLILEGLGIENYKSCFCHKQGRNVAWFVLGGERGESDARGAVCVGGARR